MPAHQPQQPASAAKSTQNKRAAAHAAAHTYDRAHARWEKFNVEAAMEEADSASSVPVAVDPVLSESGNGQAAASSLSTDSAVGDTDMRPVSTRRTVSAAVAGGVQFRWVP